MDYPKLDDYIETETECSYLDDVIDYLKNKPNNTVPYSLERDVKYF